MWGGVFSCMDCLLIHYRQKDDPLNVIAAGFITGGVLAIRGTLSKISQLSRWCQCGIQERRDRGRDSDLDGGCLESDDGDEHADADEGAAATAD